MKKKRKKISRNSAGYHGKPNLIQGRHTKCVKCVNVPSFLRAHAWVTSTEWVRVVLQNVASMLQIWWNVAGVHIFSSSGRGYVGVNLLMQLRAQVTDVKYSLSLFSASCVSLKSWHWAAIWRSADLSYTVSHHKKPTEGHSCWIQCKSSLFCFLNPELEDIFVTGLYV